MRSVVVGVIGLILSVSLGVGAFGATLVGPSDDATQGKEVLRRINGTAKFALSDVNLYKYKIAGLCKFVGQLIPTSERAESLSEKLQGQKGNEALADNLMKVRAILYVAQVDICTALKTYGQPQGFDKKTEDQDANTLEQNFLELLRVSSDR